jgi:MFS transporter, SHS family, sialic acid transporter
MRVAPMAAAPSASAPIAVRPPGLPGPARVAVLAATFAGLVFAGLQLGLMPLASRSVSLHLMGSVYTEGMGGGWLAWYTASIMLGAAAGGVTLGALGDRAGRTRAMAVSVLLYSLAGAAGAIVTSQDQLLILRFVAGLGVGGVWPNAVALVSECWAGVSRPTVAGIMGAAINVGILLVAEMGRLHPVGPSSWRWLMATGGLLSVPLALLAFTVVPESPAWRVACARPRDAAARTPVGELFHGPMRRRTFIGIALAAIPLIGAWAASKWMIPWADHVAGTQHLGYKAMVQGYWAFGAILGSFLGAPLANLAGRRLTYVLISIGSCVITCGIFLTLQPLHAGFVPAVFAQGFVTTLFFGWLPLYLPELFPTRVRASGSGIAYNTGRIASAAGVLVAGSLLEWSGGNYAGIGVIAGLVYAVGAIVPIWAPDTSHGPLDDPAQTSLAD